MLQYFLNDICVLDTGDDIHLATAVLTFLDFYSKDPLQSLRPRHQVGLVKFTRGFGTNAARRPMNAIGLRTT